MINHLNIEPLLRIRIPIDLSLQNFHTLEPANEDYKRPISLKIKWLNIIPIEFTQGFQFLHTLVTILRPTPEKNYVISSFTHWPMLRCVINSQMQESTNPNIPEEKFVKVFTSSRTGQGRRF